MDISDIEQLVSIIRDARISELIVSTGGTKVRLKKQLPSTTAAVPVKQQTVAKEATEVAQVDLAESNEQTVASVYITAPMVGVFHGVDDVSSVGTSVKTGQVVGMIESMKLMNDVVSQYDGIIAEVLVEDGAPVEYGHPLFRLELAGAAV